MSLEDGVRRLTLPLPTGPKHVHCYLVDGTLFDTGLGLGDAPWEGAGIERIAITHFHPDHVGGAAAAAAVTGAPVFQGGLDYAQCERVWGSADWPERMAAWFRQQGAPAEVADELIEQGHGFAGFIKYALDPDLIYEGSTLAGWDVVELPGHARHVYSVAFHPQGKFLLSGDLMGVLNQWDVATGKPGRRDRRRAGEDELAA